MTHKHHIIPKHAGGTNDPENLIELSIADHVLAHKKLWEDHGKWQDYLAWQALAGLISGEEARLLAVSHALKGKPKSLEHRKKMSKARKAHAMIHGGPTAGKKLGKFSKERSRKHSEGLKKFYANGGRGSRTGQKCSAETKKKMRDSALLREKKKRESFGSDQ